MPRNRTPRIVTVFSNGVIRYGSHVAPCTLGRSGILDPKREGDGGTPVGTFAVRRLYFRPGHRPARYNLPASAILRSHGWCDDPGHALYNRATRLPFRASHERMWRSDHLYDLVLTIGHNDRPITPGHGSAVFIHLMSPDAQPTEGCIALRYYDMLCLLAWLRPGDKVCVRHRPAFPTQRQAILPLRRRSHCGRLAIN